MYDVEGKLVSGIKSMYDYSSACVRVKGGESEWGKKGVYHVSLDAQCIYGWSDEGDGDGKEESKVSGGWVRTEVDWPLVCR